MFKKKMSHKTLDKLLHQFCWFVANDFIPANASPIALPRFVLKYELTAMNDDGFMNPNPRP